MSERRQPVIDSDAATRAVAHDLPDIEIPVIKIQDLEYDPQPNTRVNVSGLKVHPPVLTKEEQEVLDALAEFERDYARLRQAGP